MNDSIGYKGVVLVKNCFKNKILKKTYYNTGTEDLFTTLSKAMAGYSISSEIPKYVDIVIQDGEDWKSILNATIQLSGTVYQKISNSWCTTYNAVIPYTAITGGTLSSSSNYRLILKDGTNSKTLAYISIEGSAIPESDSLQDMVIEWNMFFTNKGDDPSYDDVLNSLTDLRGGNS